MQKKIITLFLLLSAGFYVFLLNYGLNLQASLVDKKIEEIDKDGLGNSLFVNNNGVVFVSYVLKDGKLIFAKKDSGKWQKEIISKDAFPGYKTSINIDKKGELSILYIDKKENLKLATKNKNRWVFEDIINDAALFCNLVFDKQNGPHISFWLPQKGIAYAKKVKGKWRVEILDYGEVGWWNDITLDQKQIPHISYFDFKNGGLLYLTMVDGRWTKERIDFGVGVGHGNSIEADKMGNILISYVDSEKGVLKIAKKKKNGWLIEKIDESGFVGDETNIKINSRGFPVVSYYVLSDNSFRVAEKTYDIWKIYIVEKRFDLLRKKIKGEIGGSISSFIGNHGQNYFLWQDLFEKKLKYFEGTF